MLLKKLQLHKNDEYLRNVKLYVIQDNEIFGHDEIIKNSSSRQISVQCVSPAGGKLFFIPKIIFQNIIYSNATIKGILDNVIKQQDNQIEIRQQQIMKSLDNCQQYLWG